MNCFLLSTFVTWYTRPQPVVDQRLCGVAPGIVDVRRKQGFRELRKRTSCIPRTDTLVDKGPCQPFAFGRQVILRQWRRGIELAIGIAINLPFEFLEQADRVVLGMSLEVNRAKAIGTDRHVHTSHVAFDKNIEPGLVELLARDRIEARMRRIETRVDVAHQRMPRIADAMTVYTPLLVAERLPPDIVKIVDEGMCREAGTEN